MNKSEQIKAQISALQAELEEIERDGFKPLSELVAELKPGDLIEVKVFSLDPGAHSPVALKTSDTSNYIDHIDHTVLTRKSRSALRWITAAEAAQMPDIVGKRVALCCKISSEKQMPCLYSPISIQMQNGDELWVEKNAKLAVLDDE
jgi:hypothetical protein